MNFPTPTMSHWPTRALGLLLTTGALVSFAARTAVAAANDPIYFRDAGSPDRPEFYRLVGNQVVAVAMPQPVLDFLGAAPGDESKAVISVAMTPGQYDVTPYLTELRNRRISVLPQSDASYVVECSHSVEAVEWTYGQLLATCTVAARSGGVIWDDESFAALKARLPKLLQTSVSFSLNGKAIRQVSVPPEVLTIHADLGRLYNLAQSNLPRSGLGAVSDRGIETTDAVAQTTVVGALGLDFCGLSDQSGRWDRLGPYDSGHLSDGTTRRYNDVLFRTYDEQKAACGQILGNTSDDSGRRRYRNLRESLYAETIATTVHRDGDGPAAWISTERASLDVSVELRAASSRSEVRDDSRSTTYKVDTFLYKQ